MLSDVLLYAGTLLIAFGLVGDLSHLLALFLHSFGRLAKSLAPHNKTQSPKMQNAFLKIARVALIRSGLCFLLILVFALSIVLLFVWVVGRLLACVNAKLNSAYANALDPRKTNYIEMSRSFVGLMGKDNPNIDSLDIWEEIKKRGFPFLGLIGIIVLSVGFALRLLAH